MAASKPGLKRDLRLIDVYAISTGAMFSSGFFLLPGLAFAYAGSWIVVAYALSAVLVIPAMLSKAELASALPKAGGTYYFLDRSMGPLVGTVGGLGTWIAMGFKNTFALIGLGAYLTLFWKLDLTLVAIVGALAFTAINIFGVKETARLQRWLVYALVGILCALLLAGLVHLTGQGIIQTTTQQFGAAPGSDLDGVLATVGLVFVSYAGLTKVAGVAEEVEHPERNILLGMALSLATAVIVYTLGTYLLVMFVDHAALKTDLTPIATLAETTFDFLPGRTGVFLIVIAALAAFASTANAGIMAASRYLFAMGRDELISPRFGTLGRFQTPTIGVLATCAMIIVVLLTLDVVSVAKLASAFQLLMFAIVNVAVIVMREAQIKTYDPPFKSPFYPWTQLIGVFFCLGLIVEMGRLAMAFTLGIVAVGVAWYFFYGKHRVARGGAILHWFERLGRERSPELEHEIWSIIKETGLGDEDLYAELVARAAVLEVVSSDFDELVTSVAHHLGDSVPLKAEDIAREFRDGVRLGLVPVTQDIALPHFRVEGLERHELVLVRAPTGVRIEVDEEHPSGSRQLQPVALFFLLSPEDEPGQHLRILARLATALERGHFREEWLAQGDAAGLRRLLRGDEREEQVSEGPAAVPDQPEWQPSNPGRFQRILLVAPGPEGESTALELSTRLAAQDRAHVRIVAAPGPEAAGRLADPVSAGHRERLDGLVAELKARGVQADRRLLHGTDWLEIIREVMRGAHDLLVLAGAPKADDSFTRHLLRKCPCPVWLAPADLPPSSKRILAAVDPEAADEAHASLNEQILETASALAEQEGAELHVLSAWHLVGEDMMVSRGSTRDSLKELAGQARASQNQALTKLLVEAGLDHAHVHLVEGEAHEVIPDFAWSEQMDLVVLGTVGRTGISGYFIGNTAEDVLTRIARPVLALKPKGFSTPVRL